MNHLPAVQQALSIYERHANFDPQARTDAVVALLEWKCFSNAQVAKLTGATKRQVDALSLKTNNTGGTLAPASLPHIIALIQASNRGEGTLELVAAALNAGCGLTMLARLTGRPKSTLARHARLAV